MVNEREPTKCHAHYGTSPWYVLYSCLTCKTKWYYFISGPGPCELYLSACIRIVQQTILLIWLYFKTLRILVVYQFLGNTVTGDLFVSTVSCDRQERRGAGYGSIPEVLQYLSPADPTPKSSPPHNFEINSATRFIVCRRRRIRWLHVVSENHVQMYRFPVWSGTLLAMMSI